MRLNWQDAKNEDIHVWAIVLFLLEPQKHGLVHKSLTLYIISVSIQVDGNPCPVTNPQFPGIIWRTSDTTMHAGLVHYVCALTVIKREKKVAYLPTNTPLTGEPLMLTCAALWCPMSCSSQTLEKWTFKMKHMKWWASTLYFFNFYTAFLWNICCESQPKKLLSWRK